MRRTVVAVNAHPDDEAILMGGTLARMSAAGHRVILVTATDGGADPTGRLVALGAVRLRELQASAAALGATQVLDLGYSDSGMGPSDLPPDPGRQRLHTVPLAEAAAQVADILTTHGADLVIGYDSAGGYGHRDHVRVHHIVRRAAQVSDVRLVEATAPREPILRALGVLRSLRLLGDFDPVEWAAAFTPRADITHVVDVREHLAAKRSALSAHVSQRGEDRTLRKILALPEPVLARVLRREYFVEPHRQSRAPGDRGAFADLARTGRR